MNGPVVLACDWGAVEAAEHLLGARERAYAATLPDGRRREWARCRLTARAAVCWATGAPPRDILPDAAGRPIVLGARQRGTRVSLAHSGPVTACAVTACAAGGPCAGAVGVDVEPVDPGNDVLLDRIAAAGELGALGGLPPAHRATVLVCAKEAALKAYRHGPPGLRAYRIERGPGRLAIGCPAGGRAPLGLWLFAFAGYRMAVCAPAAVAPRAFLVGPGALARTLRAHRLK